MKGLEVFYPGKDDPPSLPLLYRGRKVEVKVGNMPISDWLKLGMPMDGVPRGATQVLTGVAISESGEIVGCVLLPQLTEAGDSVYKINWDERLTITQKLFMELNSLQ